QPVTPANRSKASPVRKHSDDCVRPAGSAPNQPRAWANTGGCLQGGDRRDRGTLRARAGRLGAAGDRARRRKPQAAPCRGLAAREPGRQIDPGPVRGPDPRHRLRTGPADRRAGRTWHPGRGRPGQVLRRAGHAAQRVRPGAGYRPVDGGAARGREHRDRRRPGRPAPPGRRAARAAGPRHRRARAARLAAAARERPAVPRRLGQRLVPVGLRRRRSHHRRGQRRRSRRGRDLDGRRTLVRVRRGLAGRCRTDGRGAVMNGKLRVAAIGVALSVTAMLLLLVVRPSLDPARLRPLPLITGAWLAFLVAAWLLRKVPRRTAVVLILLGGIGLQAVAVSVPRAYSNDLYRYMWDGRVQAAGIDPYQYVPTATQLTGLRN